MFEIGRRLREVRKQRGLSQREVASAVGMSQSTLSDLEQGTNVGRTLELVAGLGRYFEVSVDSLLGLTDEDPALPSLRALTLEETDLLELIRRLSPDQRVKVAQMARFLADQDDRWQRYERIVSAIEDLGGSRLLEQSQERLTALAGELGRFRAAISALAGEIAAAGEANEMRKEIKDQT